MRKTSLISATYAVISLFGCGGNSTETSVNTNIGPVHGKGDVKTPGPVWRGNVSQAIQNIVSRQPITLIDQNNYNDIYSILNNNKYIDYNISYKSNNRHKNKKNFYYVLSYANNKLIGEEIIMLSKNTIEGATRALSRTPKEYIGDIHYVGPLSSLFNSSVDGKQIETAIKNSMLTKQNYEVQFRINKNNLENYILSNIKINNLYIANTFTLKGSQLNKIDRFDLLQLTLATLFINFNEAKSILD